MVEDIDEPNPDSEKLKILCEELKQRCQKAQIDFEEEDFEEIGGKVLKVGIPAGRDKRWEYFLEVQDAKLFLSIPFEEYIFLSGYEAICSYKNGEIEALITTVSPQNFQFLCNQLFTNKSELKLAPSEGIIAHELEISLTSNKIKAFCSPRREQLSLKIANIHLSHHDQALSILELISN